MAVRKDYAGAAPRTTLSAALSAGAMEFTVADATGYPTGAGDRPFVVAISRETAIEEKVLCASRDGNTFTVAQNGRGFDGTVPQDHPQGARFEHVLDAESVDDFAGHIHDERDDHTKYALADGSRGQYEPAGAIGIHRVEEDPHPEMVTFPIGGIIMWSGSIETIPDTWALCDGENGTPDLRDRFIVGAGGAYAPADTGGEASVTLTVAQMPVHNHDGTADSAGSHTHGAGTLSGDSHTHGTGNYAASSHSHGSGNLAGASHTHGAGNYSDAHTHGSGNLAGGNHSHNGTNLNTSNTGSHSHTLLTDDTMTGNVQKRATVSSGDSVNRAGYVGSAGAHAHNITGNTGASTVGVSGNTAGSNATAVAGNSGGSGVTVSGNTSATAPTISGSSAGSGTGISGSTASDGSHTHTLTINNTGSGNAHENRPPYYALAFIMKLAA